MKVSQITLFEFLIGRQHISAVLSGVIFTAGLASCHHASKDVTRISEALAAPPIESIWMRLPAGNGDVPATIRQAMFSSGLQATAENRKDGWVRAALGGSWEDASRYRQWQLVVTFGHDSSTNSTLVVLRVLELLTSYTVPIGRPTGATPRGAGFTSTRPVNDMSNGEAHVAWLQLERLALALTDRGAEMLTDLSKRQPPQSRIDPRLRYPASRTIQ